MEISNLKDLLNPVRATPTDTCDSIDFGKEAACDIAGMKISISKTEIPHLSKNPVQCSLQVDGVSLKPMEKFKYLGVVFTSDGRQDKEWMFD